MASCNNDFLCTLVINELSLWQTVLLSHFHVAKKVEVTNILDSISGYSLNNFFQREKHVPSRHFHKTDMFNSTHFCICNIKWSKVFTIIFFPKKQTQPKLPLFAALSELIVVTLKSIFQCKKATFAH